MNYTEYVTTVTKELDTALQRIPQEQCDNFVTQILAANTIFISGAGRSGFMARGFAMRLMHMGCQSYLVGESVTPNTKKGDILVVCSGSGETKSLISIGEKAKSLDAKVALITINPESTIGKIADTTVQIPCPSPKAVKEGDIISIQPMGSLFEQSLLLFLDISIMCLMEKKRLDSTAMFSRHANLE